MVFKYQPPADELMSDLKSVEDKLALLKTKYIKSLPDKVTDIYMEWNTCKERKLVNDSTLTSHLHKLAGSAGMYDFFELGENARALELSILKLDNDIPDQIIDEIDSGLTKLKELVADLCQ